MENNSEKNKHISVETRWPCPLLFRRMFINVDGFTEFCVDDWLDESVIGDVRKESLSAVWRNQAYGKLRQAHLNKEFSVNKKCLLCADWKYRTWDYNYFSALERLGIKTR